MATQAKEIFVSPDEVEIDRVDITGVKRGGAFQQDHLVLTNKRLYYKGEAMALDGSSQYGAGETIVDISYITGTSFSVLRKLILMIMGVVFAMTGLFMLKVMPVFGVILLVLAALLIFVFFAGAPKVLTIQYVGGPLKIQVKGLSTGTSAANFQRFCNSVHIAAEKRRADLNS